MSFNFSEVEWKELRAEVLAHVNETRQLEKLSIGAAGIVYAWLATHTDELRGLGILPWFIPCLFAGLGALRTAALSKQIEITSAYLIKLERELGGARKST